MRFATIKGDEVHKDGVTEALLAVAAEGHRGMIEFCSKGHITVYIFRQWYWEACFGTFFHLHNQDWGHISTLIH